MTAFAQRNYFNTLILGDISAMICSDREQDTAQTGAAKPPWDQDLLLLAHGALPLLTRLRVQAHLLRCSVCRARLSHLLRASAFLAAAVRGPDLPPWSLSRAVARARPRPALWRAAVAGVLLAVLLCTAALVVTHSQDAAARAAATAEKCK